MTIAIEKGIEIEVEFLTDPNEIYANLSLGTNLPIKTELKKYIMWEIRHMNIKSIVLHGDDNEIIGHSCIYHCDGTMYFGFFAVNNSEPNLIKHLVDLIINIARERNCSSIKGPINLPQIIYGYGFPRVDSSKKVAAGTPYSDPVYLETFRDMGFSTWHEIRWYHVPIVKTPMKKIWPAKVADFEKLDWMEPFIDIQARCFPPSAKLTPGRTMNAYKMNLDLVRKYGHPDFIEMSYDGDRLIGTGYVTPNVFDLNDAGKCKSIILMGAAVEPEYRRKKVVSSMLLPFFNKCKDWGMTHAEYLVGADNEGSIAAAKAFGGNLIRTYEILEIDI